MHRLHESTIVRISGRWVPTQTVAGTVRAAFHVCQDFCVCLKAQQGVCNLEELVLRAQLQLFVRIHVVPPSSLRRSLPKNTHIDDLFVDSLWRELRLVTTVFAGVFNVAQRVRRLTILCAF